MARRACGGLDWGGPAGHWPALRCRKALARLVRRGQLRLPVVVPAESPAAGHAAAGKNPAGTALSD